MRRPYLISLFYGKECDRFLALVKLGLVTALLSFGIWELGKLEAQAAVMTTGCANSDRCTLQELFDGGTVTIDDTLFDNWSFKFFFSI